MQKEKDGNWLTILKLFQVADLREFEEFSELFPHFERQKLYHAALKQYEDKGIPCR